VAGSSAGGNLAAAVALMARHRGSPRLAFQLLIYPVIDRDFARLSYRENAEGYLLTSRAMERYWNHSLARDEDALNPHVAPIRAADLRDLPPANVITADYDPLRDEGEAYVECLRAAGVPVTHKRYAGMIHGFVSMAGALDQGAHVIREMSTVLREALKG
jgi:acetyl esterase